MSADKPGNPVSFFAGKKYSAILRDVSLLIGWISGIIVIAGLCWYFTQPARSSVMLKSVNRVLEQAGDSRRAGAVLPPSGIGTWYTLTEHSARRDSAQGDISAGKKACVFVFLGEGSFFPCMAIVSAENRVEEFIPLSVHGKRMMKRVSPGILKIYISRIEGRKS